MQLVAFGRSFIGRKVNGIRNRLSKMRNYQVLWSLLIFRSLKPRFTCTAVHWQNGISRWQLMRYDARLDSQTERRLQRAVAFVRVDELTSRRSRAVKRLTSCRLLQIYNNVRCTPAVGSRSITSLARPLAPDVIRRARARAPLPIVYRFHVNGFTDFPRSGCRSIVAARGRGLRLTGGS